jgi:uncharacterized protein (TIGR03000 family)
MLRRHPLLSTLAVAGLALLLAPRSAPAQYPVGDHAGIMSTGGAYSVSRGSGFMSYTPSPDFAGRYQFFPGMYTGDYRYSRFATTNGFWATAPSGYSPLLYTSLHYPGVYGSYATGLGVGVTVNVGDRVQTAPDNLPSDYPVGAPYAPLSRPLMDVPYQDRTRTELRTRVDSLSRPALIDVFLPANAALTFQGETTSQTGSSREFQSPPLDPGRSYTYDVRATWRGDDGREVTRTRRLTVQAGDHLEVDFNRAERVAEPEETRPMLRTRPEPLLRDRSPAPRP